MTNFLKSLCTLLLFLFAVVATAQETNVTGVIPESSRNQPPEGVTVKVSGTNRITKTGANGSFTIILREFNSLLLNNQPLFVVDGIIVDNATNILKRLL